MTEALAGTGVALVTPFNENGEIDFDALKKLVKHVMDGGVDYLVLHGTTGESPTVSQSEKIEILEVVSHEIPGNTPIVYGLGGNNTRAMVDQLKDLTDLPVQAVLSASPHYNKPSQEGIYQHYKALADASPYPVILYNVPHRTSSNIAAETTLRLAEHPNIVATKEASGDFGQCARIARDKPDGFQLISGEDSLTLPLMSVGACGVISVLANAYPGKFSEMVRLANKNQFKEASSIHLELLNKYALSNREGNPTSIKAVLKVLDLCEHYVRMPLQPASDDLIRAFHKEC